MRDGNDEEKLTIPIMHHYFFNPHLRDWVRVRYSMRFISTQENFPRKAEISLAFLLTISLVLRNNFIKLLNS